MLSLLWVSGVARRRTARVLGIGLCIALSVALVASLGEFISASNAQMTSHAIAGVPVDWQVELAPGTSTGAVMKAIAETRGVKIAREVGYGDVAAMTATTGPTVQTTGAGKALGITEDYAATFPGEIRYLAGAHTGVLLAQQTAANLHVAVGDPITLQLPDRTAVALRIDGIIDLPAADSLFQVVGAPPGAGATAPPDNVVLLPLAQWRAIFTPLASQRPDAVRTQVHLGLARDLPTTPAEAYTDVITRAHGLEAKLSGAVKIGNNVAAILDAAREDAVYSELLFLFLGLPGVVLAWLLAILAGASGHDRRRREQALMRVRGARTGRIVGLAFGEAVLAGLLGMVLGLPAALLAGGLAFALPLSALTDATTLVWSGIAVALGFILALVAIVEPARRDARLLTVHDARAEVGVVRPPLWSRLYVDLLLLGGAGVIFWQSTRDAYHVVLVPEGVPTISINYLTLLAPMMFWIGFALLAWRLSDLWLGHGTASLAALLRPLTGRLSSIVTASMSRQRHMLSRSLVLVSLAISFAISVAIFNTTYMNQARIDAELTNGADVSVVSGASGLAADLPTRARGVAGVADAEPMQHRLAYVGNDLQDLYGIDPTAIGRATPMSDAFFQSGTAAEVLGKLASTPDGVLVSDETVKDFELQVGDLVRLRLQGPDHAYHIVPFHYVGIAREFPTAPHDSFLVANSAYVAKATGVSTFETLLIKTTDSPETVAAAMRKLLGTSSGATVHDLVTELKVTLSGLTAIDLTGLTRLELVFAVLMAVAASGLMMALGFAERRRSFAIAHALGARSRQLASFVWAEALFTALGGGVLGAIGGWLQALIVVKILTGVFDPPPEALAVPWTYLGFVALATGASVAIAATAAMAAARRPALGVIRDL